MSPNPVPTDTLDSRQRRKIVLDQEIRTCRRCEGMNVHGVTGSAPGYGCVTSSVALVGQSLCEKCMESQIPFTGGSGGLVDEAIAQAGYQKADLFITNAVHCRPPKNRASHEHEIINCAPFLHRELEIVQPRLVITLGADAARVLEFFYPRARMAGMPFEAPKGRLPKGVPYIVNATHPSWIQRQHKQDLKSDYMADLVAAIRWGFGRSVE